MPPGRTLNQGKIDTEGPKGGRGESGKTAIALLPVDRRVLMSCRLLPLVPFRGTIFKDRNEKSELYHPLLRHCTLEDTPARENFNIILDT